jgi:hypothetical protein
MPQSASETQGQRGGPPDQLRRIEAGHLAGEQLPANGHEAGRDADADEAADAGEQDQAFPEELRQDAALGGAEALRRPISRVRSVTETSMMLMMPTAPRPRVTMPTPPRKDIHGVEDLVDQHCEVWMVSHSSKASLRRDRSVIGADDRCTAATAVVSSLCDGGLVLDGGERVRGMFSPFMAKSSCMVVRGM